MSNHKHISTYLRSLTLSSLILALAGAALIAPGTAAAASCNPNAGGPQACVAINIHVYDKNTGIAIDDATVKLDDKQGNVSAAYLAGQNGMYMAFVTPDGYKITVSAPGHMTNSFSTVVETTRIVLGAPLVATSLLRSKGRTSPTTGATTN
jgi:hypothetical protein